MKKDISFPKVEDVAVAVVREENEHGEMVWNAYLLNLKPEEIYGVLVSSRGYGMKDNEQVKTSALRHFFETIPAQTAVKIEPIMDELLGLSNEFWVSFYSHAQMYDKKYIFLAEGIKEENYTSIPLLEKQGILIR